MDTLEIIMSHAATISPHVIMLAFSGIGLILLLLLVWREHEKQTGSRKAYRSKRPGVADLLNWAAVIDDGIIINKNGSLMAAWLYRGGDNASATNTDRNAVSHYINAALKQFGSGWMVHIDAIRRPCPSYSDARFSHFPDPVSQAFDNERRTLFSRLNTLYEGCFVLTATWFPPTLAQAKFVELMVDNPDGVPSEDLGRGEKMVADFKRDVASLEGRLASALNLERLGGHTFEDEQGETITHDDFLRWLHYCLTGDNQPVILPRNPAFIDNLVGGRDMTAGMIPLVGDKYVMVVAIDNYPFESYPGILAKLGELPCEYRWNSRFIFLDNHEAVALINKYKRKWRQKIRGFKDQVLRADSGSIDHNAKAMFDDCEMALLEVNSGAVAMGLYTSLVVLMGEDLETVRNSAAYIQKALAALGFPARIEDVNTMDAFIGSLPGHGVENLRRAMMNTRHLADLMPTNSIWTGNDYAPCPFYPEGSPPLMHCVTTGDTPFRLNLHVRDLGHSIIFGPTGAGKSVLLATLTAQFLRYQNMTLYAFDKGNSLYTMCRAVGGRHYTIAGDEERDEYGRVRVKYSFCPLQWLKSNSDLVWACTWIETLLALNGVQVTANQRNEIARRMAVFHKNGEKTLLSFVTGLMDNAMTEALEIYTREGSYGYLLDADEDSLDLKDEGGLTVFEIDDLMALGDPRIVLPVLLYLFHRIELSLRGQPAAILLDEAWLALGHEAFRNKLREWYKTMRKNNCAIIAATQSLSDAANSGIVDVIRESTATKIFLPNPHAKGEETAETYKRLGLNSRQIHLIANAIPKRQYYYTSEEGNRLFELALGPLQLALLAVSDKDSIATVKKLEQRHGDGWLAEWLTLRGISPDVIAEITKKGTA